MGLQFYTALSSNIENSFRSLLTFLDTIFLKIITFVYLQWSSSHEERTKIIQEGLLNPSADILKAMSETEALHTGKALIHSQIPTLSFHN